MADNSTHGTSNRVELDPDTMREAAGHLHTMAGRVETLLERVSAFSEPAPAGADEVSQAAADKLAVMSSGLRDALREFVEGTSEDARTLQETADAYEAVDTDNAHRFEQIAKNGTINPTGGSL